MSEGITPSSPRDNIPFSVAVFVIVLAVLGVVYFELTTPLPPTQYELPAPAPSSSFISECA